MAIDNNLDRLLVELRAVRQGASQTPLVGGVGAEGAAGGVSDAPQVDFATVLQSTLDHLNQMQHTVAAKQHAFEEGSPDVNLQDVMVSLQKASLSFQAMVQVRNKLVSAYQDVMNMQV